MSMVAISDKFRENIDALRAKRRPRRRGRAALILRDQVTGEDVEIVSEDLTLSVRPRKRVRRGD